MLETLEINKEWYFDGNYKEGKDLVNIMPYDVKIGLPHQNVEIPYNYFDEKMYQIITSYKKELTIPKEWKDRSIWVNFEGVMCAATVYLNGELVGEHKGGYTPFSFEITSYLSNTEKDSLAVVVDSTERADIPPFGGTIDYLTYGGIYRGVSLTSFDEARLTETFIKTPNCLEDQKELLVTSTISEMQPTDKLYGLRIGLYKDNTCLAECEKEVSSGENSLTLEGLKGILLWELTNPVLYDVRVELSHEGHLLHKEVIKIGFRQAEFKPEGFFLNGERVQLIGLNRHESFPYVGYAMPDRVQKKDADILKEELGLNMVRTSHYPQSKAFLDRCDEIGLLVFEEIPGWQHTGDLEWQDRSVQDVRDMIVRDRNHPSIVIWGVRINEAQDNHDFYTRTNELARSLDDTRATGGVRYLENSEFLEDVYTMNDFILDGGLRKRMTKVVSNYETYDNIDEDNAELSLREPRKVTGLDEAVPYLVTEYNGHMFPTKRFDQEERLIEVAMRHAKVQNAAYKDPEISGALGWCAFDYNTHADFGSGDKICYHGVMDMFRLPKYSAAAYQSQRNIDDGIVMTPMTHWARGERSMGGVTPLVIFTNCDEVRFYTGETCAGTFKPDYENFGALPHPPIVINEFTGNWGEYWYDAYFEGLLDGEVVITSRYSASPVPSELCVEADDTTLTSGDWDATRVVVKVLDQTSQVLPFFMDPISIDVEGVGEIIGPNTLSLIGGEIAFWVKTFGNPGEIEITVKSATLGSKILAITVE